MLSATELATKLRANGCKVTPQRLAIYDMLSKTTEHPTAETIYNKLKPLYPAMSLATVYKSVEVLEKIDAIQVLNTGEDSFRYDANVAQHFHIKCMHCGKVMDVPCQDLEPLVENLEKKTQFTITGQQVYFYGICPDCQKQH